MKTATPSVLLVEDEKIVQMVFSSLLKKFGCKVTLAETGKEALEKANSNGYDMIFMDIGLPDMRGTDVTAEIRHSEKDTHTPIVAVTGYSIGDVKDECDAAGIDAIYNKPVSINELKNILIKYANLAEEAA